MHDILGAGFLIFAVKHLVQAMGPAVAMIPVKVAPLGEELVLRAGVGNVTNQRVDVVLVGSDPGGIEMGDHGGAIYEIAVMEVVVVVVCVPKIGA